MFLVPFGKIADIYGRKKIFKYGIAIDLIASLLLVFSSSSMELIALRSSRYWRSHDIRNRHGDPDLCISSCRKR